MSVNKADLIFCSSSSSDGPRFPISFVEILNFCANNYLGLSSHPEVVKAGIDALQKYGAGLSSVRFICGTQVRENNVFEHIDRLMMP